jgi:hypothetical protein
MSQLGVGGQESDAFGERLREEDSVERIFVQVREGVDADGVLARDRQLGVAVIEQRVGIPAGRRESRRVRQLVSTSEGAAPVASGGRA